MLLLFLLELMLLLVLLVVMVLLLRLLDEHCSLCVLALLASPKRELQISVRRRSPLSPGTSWRFVGIWIMQDISSCIGV